MQESKKSPEQVEQERFTRRQVMRKLGFGAGLSAFMLLGVDDLARMVGQKMQQMDGDNKVANQVAREFQSAGIAFAGAPSGSPSSPPNPCQACEDQLSQANDACAAIYYPCTHCGRKPEQVCLNAADLCTLGATYQYDACKQKNGCP